MIRYCSLTLTVWAAMQEDFFREFGHWFLRRETNLIRVQIHITQDQPPINKKRQILFLPRLFRLKIKNCNDQIELVKNDTPVITGENTGIIH